MRAPSADSPSIRPIPWFTRFGLVLATLALVATIVAGGLAARRYAAAAEWTRHTATVLVALANAGQELRAIEESGRPDLTELRSRIGAVCSLTADNPAQRARCDSLGRALSAVPVDTRAIVTAFRAMAAEERRLMLSRQDAQDAAAHHAAILSAASLAVCVLLALAAFRALARSAKALARAKAELRQNRELYRAVAEHLPKTTTAIFDTDLRFQLVDGGKLLASLGRTCEEFRGRTVQESAPPETREHVVRACRKALEGVEGTTDLASDGRELSFTALPVRDATGEVIGGLAVLTDVTEQRRAQQKLTRLAEKLRSLSVRDELTGLYNRRGFHAQASEHAAAALATDRGFGVVFADLNGLKVINDEHGHEYGDAAIREMGAILTATARASDVTARLGGDEFVILVRDADASALEAFARRARAAVERSNGSADRPYALSVSLGSAVWKPGDDVSIDALIEEADQAMYAEKRGRVVALARAS